MWPDVYEHCHRCEKIKQKVDMVAVDGYHVCVECVPAIFANERAAVASIAKYAADLHSRVGYLETAIVRAYEAKDWTLCLDALEQIHKSITSGDRP
jgi:hypothetical protein